MKIRRYMGSDTQEALLKVKMDLGNDAVILNTRKVRQKGLMKLFSKPMVEVLAALDEEYGKKKENETVRKNEGNREAGRSQNTNSQSPVSAPNNKVADLENKVNNMEVLLQKIYSQMKSATAKSAEADKDEKSREQSNVLQVFYGNLVRNDVDPELARKIIQAVSEKVGENAAVNDAASVLYNMIAGLLGKPETLKLREDGKPTVVIFVGPTGVGKTTTLAKIAANYALGYKKKVGLITADTYRIAAVEQLKTYSEILGIPISVAYSPCEIGEAINGYSDRDLILIDTAGRSTKNKSQFEELKALVMASQADETYLVLSTTTGVRNCRELVSNYNFMEQYKLIFTKLDESPVSGILLNARQMTGKPLSYITTGQSVPDDIEVVSIEKITKNLLGSIT
jgi:flagellar biosynthesis protein FlhF